jgi:predicted MFS family arabinose efflux permease
VAGYIAEHYDWRYGFYLFGGGGMVLAAILYLFLKEPRRGQSEKPEPPADELLMMHGEVGHGAKDESPLPLREVIAAVFRSRTAPLLMLAFLGANFVATIFMTWTPTFLAEKFDFTLGLAGLSGALFINLASAVGAPLGGVLADRFALRLPGGRMLVQLAGLLVGGVTLFFVGGGNDGEGLAAGDDDLRAGEGAL